MFSIKTVALTVFVWLAVGSYAFADVQLSFRDGHVSIVATDATVGQILAEWAKIGQTTIANVERIPRDRLTIQLENVTESRALDVVLRTVSGYITAPRAVGVPNASRFDRIIIMPTSTVMMASASTVMPASASPRGARFGAAPAEYQTPAYTPPQESQTPAYSQPQSTYEPPPPADDTPNDDPQAQSAGAAIPSQDSRGSVRNTAREALETIDPRKFRLPTQPQGGGTVVSPSRSLLPGGGVAAPGMIAQPRPR